MDRKTVQALVLVGFVASAAGIVVAQSLSNPAPIEGGVPLGAPSGLYVTVDGTTSADLENFSQPNSDTVEVVTTDGNVTVTASGASDVTIAAADITGTWTNATDIGASFAAITIDPEDKAPVTVGGDITAIDFRAASEVGADDGTVDFVYNGTSPGTSRVTLQGVGASTQYGAVDANSGALLDVATSDGGGQITFDQLDNSEHAVTIETSDGPPTIADESPTGDLDQPPSTITATVGDPDFPGDNVDVTVDLDGSQIHSETISAEQSVSTSVPAAGETAGQHTITFTATDEYGQTRTETVTYRVPDTLYIRNATNHSQLVDAPVNVDVTIIGDQQVFTRNTTDGTVNLTGLPVDQDFVVEAEPDASSNYTSSTTFLTTIYQQQSVYLINTTATDTVETRFVLEDPTGQFGPETMLYVEKPINISGSITYQSVVADKFGVEGVTATLEEGQRYRLRIRNQEGTTQIVGPYRADVSETVTVRPGTPQIAIGDLTDGWAANATLDNRTLNWRYADPDDETDQLEVAIYEQGNKSNLLVSNETYFDLGNASRSIGLTEAEAEKTWVVRFEVTRNGETFVTTKTLSNRPDVLPEMASEWRLLSGILLLLLSAGAFSLLNASVGAVVVASEGALLWWIGWLDGATSGILVVISLFVAVMVSMYDNGRV